MFFLLGSMWIVNVVFSGFGMETFILLLINIPYHPCMVYLPAFTIKINQM